MDFDGKDYVDKHMPSIGLGTFEVRSEKTIFNILDAALDVGYRLIDTAQVYRNEKFIGNALKELLPKYNLKRENVFIISKLGPASQGAERCRNSILESLEKLQVDYIDLFLIHWPGSSKLVASDIQNKDLRRESWICLEELFKEGKLRSIGISNYNVSHIEELLSHCTVSPAVNQCEYHPHYYQTDLVKFCKEHNIHFQAYSSLGSETNKKLLFDDEKICLMAKEYNISITNFLLSWAMSQGISVLPRSQNPEHVRANFASKDVKIADKDIIAVKTTKIKKFCWDPASIC